MDALRCTTINSDCDFCGATAGEGCRRAAELTANFSSPEAPKDINPKDVVGGPKFSLSLLPLPALACIEPCFRDGARKYGAANWRDQPISARVYVDAAFRHLMLWLAGQEVADDSGVCHLASAASNLLILLDARECGTMRDDRIATEHQEVLADLFEALRAHHSKTPT